MAKALESFAVARSIEGYLIQIEDEDGEKIELTLTFDQLEQIEEEVERAVDEAEDEDVAYDDDDEDAEVVKDQED